MNFRKILIVGFLSLVGFGGYSNAMEAQNCLTSQLQDIFKDIAAIQNHPELSAKRKGDFENVEKLLAKNMQRLYQFNLTFIKPILNNLDLIDSILGLKTLISDHVSLYVFPDVKAEGDLVEKILNFTKVWRDLFGPG